MRYEPIGYPAYSGAGEGQHRASVALLLLQAVAETDIENIRACRSHIPYAAYWPGAAHANE